MVRAIALAGMLAGCFSAHPVPGAPCTDTHECPSGLMCIANQCDRAGASDAAHDDAGLDPDAVPADAAMAGPNGWFPASPVPGVNTSSNETDPSFTADRLTIAFTSDRPGGTGGTDLYIGTRGSAADPFVVRELAELDSTATERSPELSQNGLTIYFVSNRSGTGVVYQAARGAITDPFGAPAALSIKSSGGGNANSQMLDVGFTPDGLQAITVRNKNVGDQVFGYTVESTGALDTEVALTTLDLGTQASSPSLDTGGAQVYLDAATPAQIYMAQALGGTFSTPTTVDDFNSTGTRNAAPEIAADNMFIMFERDGDIVQSTK